MHFNQSCYSVMEIIEHQAVKSVRYFNTSVVHIHRFYHEGQLTFDFISNILNLYRMRCKIRG